MLAIMIFTHCFIDSCFWKGFVYFDVYKAMRIKVIDLRPPPACSKTSRLKS